MKNGWCIGNYGELVHYINNIWHNEKGPARIWDKGSKFWHQNNKYHRVDGPALECFNGAKLWFYQDKEINCKSQQDFDRIIKLKLLW